VNVKPLESHFTLSSWVGYLVGRKGPLVGLAPADTPALRPGLSGPISSPAREGGVHAGVWLKDGSQVAMGS
jgi:hypothetical protein